MSKVIAEPKDQEDLCRYCEVHVLDVGIGGSNTQFFQCEGCKCEESLILYEENYPTKMYYFFKHKISRSAERKSELLDERIRLLQCLNRARDIYGNENSHVKTLRKLISENKKVSKKF